MKWNFFHEFKLGFQNTKLEIGRKMSLQEFEFLYFALVKMLIKNIKGLVQVREQAVSKLSGSEMKHLPVLEDAWLAIENGQIADYGSMAAWPGINDWRDLEVVDASGKFVLPAWVDSHTHIVYAGTREGEFIDRIKGLTYEEIAAKGGGIVNSAKKLQDTSEEELLKSAKTRLDQIIKLGTGAVEIKSGYGLTVDAELKMLRVIRQLKELSPVVIKSTFLGAHAFPPDFKDDHQGYIDLLINEMIPRVAEENLADFIDVFCESNYFSVQQTEQIMQAGIEVGLRPKVHVNQFTSIGGVEACVKANALSVDHLEVMEDSDFVALRGSSTMATVLPGCSLFISIPYSPARKMIDMDISVALATDYNPGSAPSGNMNLVNSLAAIKMNMTPEEIINASTINGAYAMDNQDIGSITIGHKANLNITKEIPTYGFMMYNFGENPIETTILNGEIQ